MPFVIRPVFSNEDGLTYLAWYVAHRTLPVLQISLTPPLRANLLDYVAASGPPHWYFLQRRQYMYYGTPAPMRSYIARWYW